MEIWEELRRVAFSAGFAMHGFVFGYLLAQLLFGPVYSPLFYLAGSGVFLAISFRYS